MGYMFFHYFPIKFGQQYLIIQTSHTGLAGQKGGVQLIKLHNLQGWSMAWSTKALPSQNNSTLGQGEAIFT